MRIASKIHFPRPWGKYGKMANKLRIGDSIEFDDEIIAGTFIRTLSRYKKKGRQRRMENYRVRVWRVK